MKGYQHPLWMQAAGWIVVAVMSWMGYITIQRHIGRLLKTKKPNHRVS